MFMSRGVGDKKKFEDREQREREQREREQREREEREKRELKPKLENRLPAVPAVRTRPARAPDRILSQAWCGKAKRGGERCAGTHRALSR